MVRFCAAASLIFFCVAAIGQENPERILQAAIGLHQAGKAEQAIPQYRAYLKLRPEAVDARSNLGVALASTGTYGEAIAEYREALKGLPQDQRIRLNLATVYYRLGRRADGDREKALSQKLTMERRAKQYQGKIE